MIETQPTDTERLDWLEAQSQGKPWIAGESKISPGYKLLTVELGFGCYLNTQPTARAAIDAAMRRERGE